MITREGEGGVHGGAEERGIHNAPHPGSHRRVYRTLMQPDAVGSFSDGDEKERLDPGQRLLHRLDVAVISDRNHFGTRQVNGVRRVLGDQPLGHALARQAFGHPSSHFPEASVLPMSPRGAPGSTMYHPAFVLIVAGRPRFHRALRIPRHLTSSADSHCILIRQVH
jgi:hypothetical protein